LYRVDASSPVSDSRAENVLAPAAKQTSTRTDPLFFRRARRFLVHAYGSTRFALLPIGGLYSHGGISQFSSESPEEIFPQERAARRPLSTTSIGIHREHCRYLTLFNRNIYGQ